MEESQKVFLRLKNEIDHSRTSIEFNNKSYNFERVFKGTQQETYNIVARDLTSDFIRGYNATLLAYGQTGSGKTYTIQGTSQEGGIIQRSISNIFKGKSNDDEVYISYIEIYNEILFDLFLNRNKTKEKDSNNSLNIREDPEKGITVDNLTVLNIKNYDEAIQIFDDASRLRKTASTKMNIQSSRSHAIFTIYITNSSNKSVLKKNCKFHIVDLAGSERADIKYTDERIKESGGINKSLLCLSSVIEKLGKEDHHVNYRDSKLTYLLKDCLGGNAKLVVIGNINHNKTVNPGENKKMKIENDTYDYLKGSTIIEIDQKENNNNSVIDENSVIKKRNLEFMEDQPRKRFRDCNFYETINTLNFLSRVKSIKNNPIANTEFNGDIDELKKELKELHQKYEKLRIDSLSEKNKESREGRGKNRKNDILVTILRNKGKILLNKIKRLKNEFSDCKTLFFKFLMKSADFQNEEIRKISKIYKEIVEVRNKQINEIFAEKSKNQ